MPAVPCGLRHVHGGSPVLRGVWTAAAEFGAVLPKLLQHPGYNTHSSGFRFEEKEGELGFLFTEMVKN